MDTASYYYAGGERVPIVLDNELVALDLGKVTPRATATKRWLGSGKRGQQPHRELRIVERSLVPSAVLSECEGQAAVHAVYRHGDTMLVPLPEVRVEVTKRQESRLRALVENGPIEATIEGQRGGRLVLRPRSGRGTDALALANEIHEAIHPHLSDARFLRIVRRPDWTRLAAR